MLPVASTLTAEEFLVWERDQTSRHLYVDGEIFAMAGGSPRHNRLGARTIAQLERALSGGPRGVFTSDQKLGLPGDEFVYADVIVICGPVELRLPLRGARGRRDREPRTNTRDARRERSLRGSARSSRRLI
jgi:Uma2 family endonuclease